MLTTCDAAGAIERMTWLSCCASVTLRARLVWWIRDRLFFRRASGAARLACRTGVSAAAVSGVAHLHLGATCGASGLGIGVALPRAAPIRRRSRRFRTHGDSANDAASHEHR